MLRKVELKAKVCVFVWVISAKYYRSSTAQFLGFDMYLTLQNRSKNLTKKLWPNETDKITAILPNYVRQ